METYLLEKSRVCVITKDERNYHIFYQIIAGVDSLLIVCNTKTEAQQFFQLLKEAKQDNVHLFHISAGMCRAHRTDIIIGLRNALGRARQRDTKVICVSTQVIEAGVDISFMSVIRLQAGMDSIIQSAGRCNRHGEMNGTAIMYEIDDAVREMQGEEPAEEVDTQIDLNVTAYIPDTYIDNINQNITNLKINNAKLYSCDYLIALKDLYTHQIKIDILFLDPPYKMNDYQKYIDKTNHYHNN